MPGDAATIRWVDNHCHLDGDASATVERARAAGVVKLIDIGCDLDSATAAVARAQQLDGVWATVGLHPHEARHGLAGIERLLASDRVVAVGECGLDFHYDHSPRSAQRDVFAAQIAWAHEYDLPLVIHTRDAWVETFEILDREGVPARTIFHCFTGGVDEARQCVDRGAYLSFSGIVSFHSARELHAAAAWCPADRLLVETDAPYLAPVPHRGKPNQPAWVVDVGAAIAELRAVSPGEVAAVTWANAHAAYPGLAPTEP